MNIQKMKNMEEGKFFFLGMASQEKRVAFIKDYIHAFAMEGYTVWSVEAFSNNQAAINLYEKISKTCFLGAGYPIRLRKSSVRLGGQIPVLRGIGFYPPTQQIALTALKLCTNLLLNKNSFKKEVGYAKVKRALSRDSRRDEKYNFAKVIIIFCEEWFCRN